MIKTQYKFESKIPNDSKVIVFTRNHTDDDDEDVTKNNMSPSVRGDINITQVHMYDAFFKITVNNNRSGKACTDNLLKYNSI